MRISFALVGEMAAEMVKTATSDKLKETDWAKNIEICELVARDPGQAKDVIKSIKKRLGSKNPNVQLFAVMLLEMLMNNCGENTHRLVIDRGLLPILVKIVKKKTDNPVRERIFLLLDATQTALGGAKGKFPQYYAAYYDLVSALVQFPQRPRVAIQELQTPTAEAPQDSLPSRGNDGGKQTNSQAMPDSRCRIGFIFFYLMKGATDEFVLDLVEQCSFQKQRVMHLVMTSRDENIVTQAIDLNEQLHKALIQHDALLSVRPTSTVASCINDEQEDEQEEEDAERLYLRLRKGKACAEDCSDDSIESYKSVPEEMMRRPLIRPLIIQPPDPENQPRGVNISPSDPETKRQTAAVSIPPPPAKHVERERFFQEKRVDGSGLSLHSRNGSSSQSGSTDFSD
ncbi:Hepatocyte growth factor-regulated tyrosine kinase substrate [Ananas comosus]|uniref:Hepatocyte growth factor-regulated tyrosine kinase substrate n=1 Tax=Ananas comosus TaxID=4615 RepID=A0A199VVP9_ANACO|nr:Hepatocyte growth factor-regulated tyrosine kinase substrate [Ananas comosus]